MQSKINDQLLDIVRNHYVNTGNITQSCINACKEYGVDYNDNLRRAFSNKLKAIGLSEKEEISDEFLTAQKREFDKKKKRFIISWAQSDTEINEEFFSNIESYAKAINASIHIIAGRYKNPTSLYASKSIQDQEKEKSMCWDKRVVPYLDANRHNIHDYLTIASDVKVQPTASTPLSGLNSLTALDSCIVGHPRLHFESLPVLDGYPNKLIMTTGAVTKPNYTDTKSGKKGEFHHCYGFVVAELDGDVFHVRQVSANDDGSFYDLDVLVEDQEIHLHSGAAGIVFGDLHLGETDKVALKVSFDMANRLNCSDSIVLHDCFNGHSISHHERNLPFELLKREENGSNSLKKELKEMVDFFEEYLDYNFVIVKSNHDVFLDRWLNDNDWRKNNNKEMYLRLSHMMIHAKDSKGVIPTYLEECMVNNVYCLGINESYSIEGVECGLHGHLGTNGSRGGIVQFKNLNTKTITGHSHSPRRQDGAIVVGTLTHLRVGYNNGPSSWMNSNAVIYPGGKVQNVHIINGKYTTLKWK